jgi:hypothetical protein
MSFRRSTWAGCEPKRERLKTDVCSDHSFISFLPSAPNSRIMDAQRERAFRMIRRT